MKLFPPAALVASILASSALLAQGNNLVPNAEFLGTAGQLLPINGTVDAIPGVPDSWRAFAVNGGGLELEIIPAVPDEIYPGSPATNCACLRITSFGADQGFDDDNGRFPIGVGVDYQAEFWIKSGNFDGTDQAFNFGFPIFRNGAYLGREPGGLLGQIATTDWQKVSGAVFRDGEADQGHISWRCIDDGNENRICIALPAVQSTAGQVLPPSGLFCRRSGDAVELTWGNNAAYDSLRIERDGAVLAELAGDAVAYTDAGIPEGTLVYKVVAVAANLEDGPGCEIDYFKVLPLAGVSADLGEINNETGLSSTVTGNGGDGENEFSLCGPDIDLREGRTNIGNLDDDVPDGLFYFTITDKAIKSQETVSIKATVFDDPALAGTQLFLQYTNNQSRGPADIPNTFFSLASPETRSLNGTGDWEELEWVIEDAGFRSFQQGQADFRIGVNGNNRVCLDSVVVAFEPVPTNITCRRSQAGVALTWRNSAAYDSIAVDRDGDILAVLPAGTESYSDADVPDGDHLYSIGGLIAGIAYRSRTCARTVVNLPDGTRVSVDLGDPDQEDGMTHSQNADGSDGESQFSVCGPEGDLREGQSNIGAADNDSPDPFFYFNVADPPMKEQSVFRLEATVYDDPALAGVSLTLQYTNELSTGPGDIPNTFFPLDNPPAQTLLGSGAWTVLSWDIPDAGFHTFQQGSSDFRIGVTGNASVCMDRVDLIFDAGAPPAPRFRRGDADDSGVVDISDPINNLTFQFLGSFTPTCKDALDDDDSGVVDISDPIFSLTRQFLGGPPQPPPGPSECGTDPTADRDDLGNPTDLGCEAYTRC